MTHEEFTAEKKYLIAMHMAEDLRKKGLLTPREFDLIDIKLQAEIRPKFGILRSELSCYKAPLEQV